MVSREDLIIEDGSYERKLIEILEKNQLSSQFDNLKNKKIKRMLHNLISSLKSTLALYKKSFDDPVIQSEFQHFNTLSEKTNCILNSLNLSSEILNLNFQV